MLAEQPSLPHASLSRRWGRGGALAGRWEGAARDASWSCICAASHPLYFGDNAREAQEVGAGALGMGRGSDAQGPPCQVSRNLLPSSARGEVGLQGLRRWCVCGGSFVFCHYHSPVSPPRGSGVGISQVDRPWRPAGAHRADQAAASPDRGPRRDRGRRGGCEARALPACRCDSPASGWLSFFSPALIFILARAPPSRAHPASRKPVGLIGAGRVRLYLLFN